MISGRQIGGYEIQEELGRGAMGVVFKARQVSMDRIVAIKFLPKRLAQDERIVARFLREARAAGQLSHPNIVSVHELGVADGLHFIAMEFVDGNSIQKRIKEKGPYTEKEALEIAHQIAEALKMAHSRGILHRDIKPDNFLIDSAGRVRLADLGLASIENNRSDGSLTQDGTTLGTPHFMAPEQCSGSGTDARSDLYSLGASLFVMACGRTPYEGNTAAAVMVKVLTEKPASLKAIKPELSAGFVALVEKMMNKDPEKRFQNAASASEAINLCKSGHYKVVATPPTSPNKTGAGVKPAPVKSAAGATSKAQDFSTGPRARQSQSKLIPLLMGACAALALIVLLAAYKSRGTPSAPANPTTTATKNDPLPVRGTLIETTQHPSNTSPKPVVNKSEDPKLSDSEKVKHKNPNNATEQFNAIDDGMMSGRMKLPEVARKIREFREIHKLKIEVTPPLLRRVNNLEKELAKREETTAAEWKKISIAVDEHVKNGELKEALVRLSAFKTENDGLDEAFKAEEKIDDLIGGILAGAKKLADANNHKEAAAQLKEFTEIKGVPEKTIASIKSDYEVYCDRIKSIAELAGFYETASQLVLKSDKLERKNFQFTEAIKFCNEYAPRSHYDDNKRDMLELAHLFEAGRSVFNGMREQINAGARVELPGLAGFSKSKMTIVKWSDEEILYTAGEIKEPQPIKLYSASAPDAILTIAQELKRSALNTSAGMWDMGVLALAFGNQAAATKYVRDAMAKDESMSSRPLVLVASKLLKPVEVATPKTSEKQPESPATALSSRDKDAETCLKELQDAFKAGDKAKLAALRADMAAKFADTEFFKTHKKEFDEIAAGAPTNPPEPAKTPTSPEKVKPDSRTPQEKEAHEALARLGWPIENITGNWTLVNKDKNVFKVEGTAELTMPALEGDIDVYFQMLESTAKLRVMTRVIDKPPTDKFALFGAEKGTGFGADISSSSVYVYLDGKNSRIPVLFGTPMKVRDWKIGTKVHVRHRDGEISVSYDDYQPKKNAGDARTTGEIRVVVNGPMLLVPQLVKPAKLQ